MLDQLSELVKQFGGEAIVNNQQVSNEQNEAVMNETSDSILSGLKEMAASGNVNDLAGLLKGGSVDFSQSGGTKVNGTTIREIGTEIWLKQ